MARVFHRRERCESCISIDVRCWHREGLLGQHFLCSWTYRKRPSGSVRVRPERDAVVLTYPSFNWDGSEERSPRTTCIRCPNGLSFRRPASLVCLSWISRGPTLRAASGAALFWPGTICLPPVPEFGLRGPAKSAGDSIFEPSAKNQNETRGKREYASAFSRQAFGNALGYVFSFARAIRGRSEQLLCPDYAMVRSA